MAVVKGDDLAGAGQGGGAELGLLAARRTGDPAATARLLHDLGCVLRDRRRHPETASIQRWLDHPGLAKPWWSELEL
jgi:hypothetical protein